jgi:hypothetical protein
VQLQDERQLRTDVIRDVAVMRLGTLRVDGVETSPGVVITDKSKAGIIVAPFDYLTRYADVDISSQIFMLGYPSIGATNATQIDRTKPLVRGGIVAGVNAALKTIIIDAPVNHGNSGGPVVQLSRTNRLRIIGIATQFVPVPEDVLSLSPANASGPAGFLVAHVAGTRQLGLRGRRVRGRHHRSDRRLLIRKAYLRARARRAGALR